MMNSQQSDTFANPAQARMAMIARANLFISALYEQRNEIGAMPLSERPMPIHDISQKIVDMATATVYELIEHAMAVTTERDLLWISRKLGSFVAKGAWDMLGTVEEILQNAWIRIGVDIPVEVSDKLAELKARRAEYEAKRPKPVVVMKTGTMHPHGKLNKLSRAEIEKRRADNRAKRLAAQPAKGTSGGGGNNHGKQKGKKGK